jgi:transposase
MRIHRHSIKTSDVIRTVKEFRRHVRGHVVLVWDNLSAHISKETRVFLESQRYWLTVFRFPSYAPELNPVEYLWSSGKNKELAHLYVDTVDDLDIHIRKYKRRVQRHPDLLTGFLKKSSLFNRELST